MLSLADDILFAIAVELKHGAFVSTYNRVTF